MDLTFVSACGFVAFGILIGALVTERLWHLVHVQARVRPWRWVWGELRLLPEDLRWLARVWRFYITGRR